MLELPHDSLDEKFGCMTPFTMTGTLSSSLEEKLGCIYTNCFVSHGGMIVNRMPAQQQKYRIDCRVFAITFAYHTAPGDDKSYMISDKSRCGGRLYIVSQNRSSTL